MPASITGTFLFSARKRIDFRFFFDSSGGMPRKPSFPPRATMRKSGGDFRYQSIREAPPLVVAPVIPPFITKYRVLPTSLSWFSNFSSREG